MNIDDFSYEENDRRYINPQVSLDEQNAFIDKLRQIQEGNNAEISRDTQNLGTAVPSNLGGLAGGSGYFKSRYQTPQTNASIANLRTAAQSQALSTLLNNEIGKANKRYKDAYYAAKRAERDSSTSGTSGSGGNGGTSGTSGKTFATTTSNKNGTGELQDVKSVSSEDDLSDLSREQLIKIRDMKQKEYDVHKKFEENGSTFSKFNDWLAGVMPGGDPGGIYKKNQERMKQLESEIEIFNKQLGEK